MEVTTRSSKVNHSQHAFLHRGARRRGLSENTYGILALHKNQKKPGKRTFGQSLCNLTENCGKNMLGSEMVATQ